MIIIVMGVAGSGKTTVGQALARRLGGEFIEGDDYHPRANIEKMRRGFALSDRDRVEWLERLASEIATRKKAHSPAPTVVSCSALRKRYRDQLREADPDLRLVYLSASHDVLMQRLQRRQDHFMPPQLLASQLATLEPPQDDESAIVVDVSKGADEIVDEVSALLGDRE